MLIKDFSKSSFIFDLIDEFQIFNNDGPSNPLTDEIFEAFCDKYIEQAKTRDLSLAQYLKSTPDFFRTFLPESKWTFGVAQNVIWFYNELIISDPIISLINRNIPIASKKQDIFTIFETMSIFKESIIGGYMRFIGNSVISINKTKFEKDSEKLLVIPEVINSFEQSTLLIKKPSRINDNPEDNLTQLEAHYEGHLMRIRQMGTYFPPHVLTTPDKLSNGIFYDFVSRYDQLTKEELVKLGKTDLLDGLKPIYKEDISIILNCLNNSITLNTPSLFFRNIDSVIAQKYSSSVASNQKQMIIDNTLYDCTLPYLSGVPPERLFELRQQIPNAFEDFRVFLYETVKEAKKESQNVAEFRYNIESKVKRMLVTLEKEAETSSRKLKFGGINSILMLLCSLSLNSLGIGIPGAVINMDKAVDLYIDRRQNLKTNPMYFVWKAQRNK